MKYEVELKEYHRTTIEVCADNEEDAEELAYEIAYNEPWRFNDSDPYGDYETVSIIPVPEENEIEV